MFSAIGANAEYLFDKLEYADLFTQSIGTCEIIPRSGAMNRTAALQRRMLRRSDIGFAIRADVVSNPKNWRFVIDVKELIETLQ